MPETRVAAKPKTQYYLRPECGREARWGPTLGPFPDYVQLTYDLLRVGPEGAEVATRGDDGDWWFGEEVFNEDTLEGVPAPVAEDESFGLAGKPWHALGWSDVVIWGESVPAGPA